MRFSRALFAPLLLLTLSGCGYVHFGKLPDVPSAGSTSDAALSELGTKNKILQQELALAHKEGDALRAALENRTDGAAAAQLTARLNETSRELAALRASYAKLQAARPGISTAPDPELAAKLAATEDKLATSLRSFTRLQEDNSRLRLEVEQTRAENRTLTAQVKTITAENEQAQSALAQLNTELIAQKEARARAEQQTEAARSQLSAVMGTGAATTATPATLSSARAGTAASTSTATLKIESAPPSDKPATAELRTNPERLRAAAEKAKVEKSSPAKTASGTPAAEPRVHVVQVGDTLEKLAKKYYGDPGKWNLIYFANNAQLSGGRPLKAGMELEIPEN